MANMTEYLNLTLPLGSDRPDIGVLNQNFKTIDAACAKEHEEGNHDIAEVTEALHTETVRAADRENEIEAALREETARAAAAEEDNRSSIAEERQRATAAEEALSEAVKAETVRASAAESVNSEAISTEMVRALEAEKKNAAAVEAEKVRASAAEEALQSTIAVNKPVWEDKYTRSEIDNKFSTFDPAPAFTQASSRVNIESGEKLSVLLGKIKKWFADLKAVAFSGSYNDLTNKPVIPSVGNGTVTITQNGTTKGSFSMNQSGNTTIALTDTFSQTAVTGVKGNAESSYRTGNVNITPENVGALPLSGGTITGTLTAPGIIASDSLYQANLSPDGLLLDSNEATIILKNDNSTNISSIKLYSVTDFIELKNSSDGEDKNDFINTNKLSINLRLNAGTTNAMYFKFSQNSFYPSSGSVDLGISGYKWRNIYAANGTIQTSDRTKKCKIESLEEETSKAFVMGLNPVSYQMADGTSGRTHYGLIAQDIEDLMAELNMDSKDFAGFIKSPKVIVRDTDEDGKPLKKPVEEVVEGEYDYSLRYDEFIAPLIRLVQSQQNKIDRLTAELSNQQHELDEIKVELSKIGHSGSEKHAAQEA